MLKGSVHTFASTCRVENVDVVKWKGLHPIVVRVHVGNESYFDIMRHEAMKQHSSENWFLGSLELWAQPFSSVNQFATVLLNKRDKRSTVRMSLSEGNWTLIRPLTENCPPIKGMTGFKFSKQHFPKTRSWMEATKEPTRLLHLAVFLVSVGDSIYMVERRTGMTKAWLLWIAFAWGRPLGMT